MRPSSVNARKRLTYTSTQDSPCGEQCFNSAAASTGCSNSADLVSCVCSNAFQINFNSCVKETCPISDEQAAIVNLQNSCSAYESSNTNPVGVSLGAVSRTVLIGTASAVTVTSTTRLGASLSAQAIRTSGTTRINSNISAVATVTALVWSKSTTFLNQLPTTVATDVPHSGRSSSKAGVLAGSIVAGILLLAVTIGGIWFFRRRRVQNRLVPRPLDTPLQSPDQRFVSLITQRDLDQVLRIGSSNVEIKPVPPPSLPIAPQVQPLALSLTLGPVSRPETQSVLHNNTSSTSTESLVQPIPTPTRTLPRKTRDRRTALASGAELTHTSACEPAENQQRNLSSQQMEVIEHLLSRNVPANQVVMLIDRMTTGTQMEDSGLASSDAPPQYTRRP